ncbi:hypothetical protein CBR_g2757 [Chara braunii]|uniref:Peptidase A2 domain-containing protein n=1 Tax=Chara braunii TaxID=69332 RepID=A0A388KDS7_CHABU|nr:hypothetical protein CBR_g2757 [Chara braunii]|eukprot:GBG68205.1 hypothetical protein CBR_g2757 [Chara braunii]
MEPDTMGPQPTTGEAGEEYRTSPDRALRDLKERLRREAPLRWADQTNDGESDVRGEPVATEPQEALKTGTSSGRREATRRRSPEYERRDTIADRHRDDWRESLRDSYWRDRDRDRAPPRRVFDPQTGESHPLPYESKDRYIITHKASEPPTFRGYGITEYQEKWELHATRSQWSEEEIVENFLFNVDPSLGREVKEARPKDGKSTTYKKNLVELYKLENNKYFIKDLETMTQVEDESVRAFGMRFQKISDVMMKKGKISEVERCTIFIGHLSKEIVTTTGATAYRDKPGGPYSLRWDRRNNDSWRSVEDRNPRTLTDYCTRGRKRDDEPWRRRDDEIDRDLRDREQFARARRLDDYPRSPRYEADRGRGDSRGRWETDQGQRDGYRDNRYERSDRDGYRDDIYERSGRDGYRGSRYERGDRDWERRDGSRGRFERRGDAKEQRDESRGWHNRGDRRNHSRGQYEQGGSGGDCRNDSRGRNERGGYGVSSEPYPKSPDPKAARNSISRSADDRPSTPRNSCVYYRGEDHIKRDCPDLKRAIDEGLVVLDDRKYVKWADGLRDVSMFPSMKENVEARKVKPSKEKELVRSQSIKITFEMDMTTTPIRVAATKSARGSTSKKTDTDYVMTEKDGQRVDGEEVILLPRKPGVKKFLMKSSLDEIDMVEPLRRALRQPMQCSIQEYLAASKPARDELQMITRKTRIPLSEEGQGAPKAEASTVAVTGVTARADRMATVFLDGMEGVPPEKFYTLGSGAVETIINDGAVLDAVIDNGSENVIIDEDLAVQVGLGLDRSYLFEIETADGRKQQITGVCHKAAIEVQAKEEEEVIAFLKEKMVSHVAEPSYSAYANRWFFLRKPNGKIQWIQDLQKVNAVTIRDVGSAPHADLLAEGAADGGEGGEGGGGGGGGDKGGVGGGDEGEDGGGGEGGGDGGRSGCRGNRVDERVNGDFMPRGRFVLKRLRHGGRRDDSIASRVRRRRVHIAIDTGPRDMRQDPVAMSEDEMGDPSNETQRDPVHAEELASNTDMIVTEEDTGFRITHPRSPAPVVGTEEETELGGPGPLRQAQTRCTPAGAQVHSTGAGLEDGEAQREPPPNTSDGSLEEGEVAPTPTCGKDGEDERPPTDHHVGLDCPPDSLSATDELFTMDSDLASLPDISLLISPTLPVVAPPEPARRDDERRDRGFDEFGGDTILHPPESGTPAIFHVGAPWAVEQGLAEEVARNRLGGPHVATQRSLEGSLEAASGDFLAQGGHGSQLLSDGVSSVHPPEGGPQQEPHRGPTETLEARPPGVIRSNGGEGVSEDTA